MNAVGIVSEYNPLHYGHLYQLETARRETGADAVVCAMSGDFVQRGAPACLDKWQRARLAVENGVDAVVEIPVRGCLGNASIYAALGIGLMEATGVVRHVSFGSECGSLALLERVAKRLEDALLRERIAALGQNGYSFPKAREIAYRERYGASAEEELALLSGANDILALSYLQAIQTAVPHVVKREGAGYHESLNEGARFQSATGIRTALTEGKSIREHVPESVASALEACGVGNEEERLFDLVRYKLLTTDPARIEQCPQGGEGLAYKLRKNLSQAKTIRELILLSKSKRYTYTRISRLLLQLLLDIEREAQAAAPHYLRILALSERGRALIAWAEKEGKNKIPFLTNVNKGRGVLDAAGKADLALDMKAADLYNILAHRDLYENSDLVKRPFVCTKSRGKAIDRS